MDEFLKGLFAIFRFIAHCWIEIWLYLKLDQLWYKYTKWCILVIVLFLILMIYLIANS